MINIDYVCQKSDIVVQIEKNMDSFIEYLKQKGLMNE